MMRTGMKARSGYLAEVTGKSPKFASAVLACMFMASGTWVAAQAPADTNWKPLEAAMGRPGPVASDDVIRAGQGTKGGARPDELEKVSAVTAHFRSQKSAASNYNRQSEIDN